MYIFDVFNHNVTLEEYETNTLYSVASVQILRALIHYKWKKIVLSQQKIHDEAPMSMTTMFVMKALP